MMVKIVGLVAALFLATAAPALAQSACMEPIAPAAVDGSTATQAQMKSAHDDVMTFIKQSDDYQVCLFKELNDAKAAALKDKKDVDPALATAVDNKVKANQSLKEKVGGEFNTSVTAYKAAHPG